MPHTLLSGCMADGAMNASVVSWLSSGKSSCPWHTTMGENATEPHPSTELRMLGYFRGRSLKRLRCWYSMEQKPLDTAEFYGFFFLSWWWSCAAASRCLQRIGYSSVCICL